MAQDKGPRNTTIFFPDKGGRAGKGRLTKTDNTNERNQKNDTINQRKENFKRTGSQL